MNPSSSRNRLWSHSMLAILALALLAGPFGCRLSPKQKDHWWQFWRTPKGATVYPDTMVLPPPDAQSPGAGGQVSSLGEGTPPPPVIGTTSEPPSMRQPGVSADELQMVHFDYDSADLAPEARQTLDGNAAWMMGHPEFQFQIEGHCDSRGTVEYNLNLGDRRAKAVKEYLVSRGVPADKLHTISYGEERPMDPTESESAMAQNRRAQFMIYNQ